MIISRPFQWHDSFTCQTMLYCVTQKWVMLGKNVCHMPIYHCYVTLSWYHRCTCEIRLCCVTCKWVASWTKWCDMPSSCYNLSVCPVTWLVYMPNNIVLCLAEMSHVGKERLSNADVSLLSRSVLRHDRCTCEIRPHRVTNKMSHVMKTIMWYAEFVLWFLFLSYDNTHLHCSRQYDIASRTKWVMSRTKLCDMPSSYYYFSSCPVTWLIYMARGNWYLTCCLLLCQIWNAQRQKRTHSMGKSQDTPTQKQNMCIFDWKTKKTSLSKILTVTKYDTSTWEQMCLRKIQNQKTNWISWKWKKISS